MKIYNITLLLLHCSYIATLIKAKYNKHKVICEQRLYINLWTQMKTILTELPMFAYWPGRACVCGVVWCVVLGVCVWCACAVCCVRVWCGVWVCGVKCACVVWSKRVWCGVWCSVWCGVVCACVVWCARVWCGVRMCVVCACVWWAWCVCVGMRVCRMCIPKRVHS